MPRSETPKSSVIFSDSIEAEPFDFNPGTAAEIGVAERQGRLVV